jgi:hypothetical protein
MNVRNRLEGTNSQAYFEHSQIMAVESFTTLALLAVVFVAKAPGGTPLLGKLLALSANIRLGWKGLTGTSLL